VVGHLLVPGYLANRKSPDRSLQRLVCKTYIEADLRIYKGRRRLLRTVPVRSELPPLEELRCASDRSPRLCREAWLQIAGLYLRRYLCWPASRQRDSPLRARCSGQFPGLIQLRMDKLARLRQRLQHLREHIAVQRERLAEIERQIEPLVQQISALEELPEGNLGQGELIKLEEQVARLETGRRRRIEDELREFHEREIAPRRAEERRSGSERRSGEDRRRR
jgi:hypothetical protein